jgi:hypothetical protein
MAPGMKDKFQNAHQSFLKALVQFREAIREE